MIPSPLQDMLNGHFDGQAFFTPEWFSRNADRQVESPHGRLLLASCRSSDYFARQVVEQYQRFLDQAGSRAELLFLDEIDFKFSDGETCVRLDVDVSGNDVFVFQALQDPRSDRTVDENTIALLTAVRAMREWGANRVTAVVPYLAYARQEKPTKFKREPTTAKLLADLLISAGIDRVLTFDPHFDTIHGFYRHVPVNSITSLKIFEKVFEDFRQQEDLIVVAPDAGVSKLVTYFSRQLKLKSAVASKYRPQPEEAAIAEVIGDFEDKSRALLLDDMISTGGTIYALANKLVEEKGIESLCVGVSHNLCQQEALERMRDLHDRGILRRLIVTNSIPQSDAFLELPFIETVDLSEIFTHLINRIHYNRSLAELL